MTFLRIILCIVVSVCAFSYISLAAPGRASAIAEVGVECPPVVMLQDLSDQLIEGLKARKSELKTDPDVIYQLVHKIVMPHVDTDSMTRIVLGRTGYQAWQKASPELRKSFKNEFTDLVIGTYVSALQSFENESVKVYPPRVPIGNQKRVRLSAKIMKKGGSPVGMTYTLKKAGDKWMIIDFSVEGISLIQSYQSQFQAILSDGNGLQRLVDTLKKHNEAQEDKEPA